MPVIHFHSLRNAVLCLQPAVYLKDQQALPSNINSHTFLFSPAINIDSCLYYNPYFVLRFGRPCILV